MIKTFTVWFGMVVPLILLGWLVVALMAPFSRNRDTFPLLNGIYGNDVDTIHGDELWRNEMGTGFWATWLWSAWRNPVHNLLMKLGVEGKIDAITVEGTLTGGKAIVWAKVRGKWHKMYWQSGRFLGRYYQMMAGPKLWPTRIVDGVERKTRVGDYISAPLAVRILPWVSKKTAGIT